MNLALLISKERFMDNRHAACEEIDAILNIGKLRYKSANDIITMYNTIWNCLAELSNLGYTAPQRDPIVIRIIMRIFFAVSDRSSSKVCDFLLKRYKLLQSTQSRTATIQPAKENGFAVQAKENMRC